MNAAEQVARAIAASLPRRLVKNADDVDTGPLDVHSVRVEGAFIEVTVNGLPFLLIVTAGEL